jgi:hypothetical protein
LGAARCGVGVSNDVGAATRREIGTDRGRVLSLDGCNKAIRRDDQSGWR